MQKAAPSDADAQKKFQECSKIVKRLAFEKAISVQALEKSVADEIDLESMSKLIRMLITFFIFLFSHRRQLQRPEFGQWPSDAGFCQRSYGNISRSGTIA